MNVFYLIFIFILISSTVSNTLNPPEPEPTTDIEETNSTKIWIQNGCENYEKVTIQNSVNFPPRYYRYNRPWIHHHRKVKLFTSESLTYNWNWFKEHKIKGLNVTLAELMTFFDKNGCLFMPFGEGVKNIFLGSIKEISSLSIEGETTCNVLKIYELCREKFNIHVCGVKPTKTHNRMTLGIQDDHERFLQSMIDPIVITSWNTTFNRPKIQWEFTANSVGIYDNTAGKIYLIDMHGKGLIDACRHFIEIPVKEEKWDRWLSGNLVKLLRYYNLEAEAFYAPKNVREFVLNRTKTFFVRIKFQEYYCRYVMRGFFFVYRNQVECRIIPLDSRKLRLQKIINDTLINDFGPFWDREMIPAIEGINIKEISSNDFHEVHHHRQVYSWPSYLTGDGHNYDGSSEDDLSEPINPPPYFYPTPRIWNIISDPEVDNIINIHSTLTTTMRIKTEQPLVTITSTTPSSTTTSTSSSPSTTTTSSPSTTRPTIFQKSFTHFPNYDESLNFDIPDQKAEPFDIEDESKLEFGVPQKSEDYITYD